MEHLRADHPAHILSDAHLESADFDDDFYPPFLDLNVSGGYREPDTRTLRHWHAKASVSNHAPVAPLDIPVARLHATVVSPMLGHPWDDLDHIDSDAEALGSVFFDGQNRSEAFAAIAEDWGGPVLLVNSFVVEPDWRGTGYAVFIAARVLDVFAHMGLSAAALHACPIPSETEPRLEGAARARVQSAIADMWSQVGFSSLEGEPEFMAMSLDPFFTTECVAQLAEEFRIPERAREV